MRARNTSMSSRESRLFTRQHKSGGSRSIRTRQAGQSFPRLTAVLGFDLLIPVAQPAAKQQSGGMLFCRMKGAEAHGHRTPDGFVVLQGSTALLHERESAKKWPYVVVLRNRL